MNRRTFAAGISASLLALSTASASAESHLRTSVQLSRELMQTSSSESTPAVATPAAEPFDFSHHSGGQIMYVGMLATWLEIGTAAMENFASTTGALAEDVMSRSATADAHQAIGAWRLLYADMSQFTAPEPFSEAHSLLVEAYRNLDAGATYFGDGLTSLDGDLIRTATEYIIEGRDLIDSFNAVLPVAIPDRNIIED